MKWDERGTENSEDLIIIYKPLQFLSRPCRKLERTQLISKYPDDFDYARLECCNTRDDARLMIECLCLNERKRTSEHSRSETSLNTSTALAPSITSCHFSVCSFSDSFCSSSGFGSGYFVRNSLW